MQCSGAKTVNIRNQNPLEPNPANVTKYYVRIFDEASEYLSPRVPLAWGGWNILKNRGITGMSFTFGALYGHAPPL
jgi:hypothetical protein